MKNKLIIGKDIDIRIQKKEDLNTILSFQKNIIDNMTNKEWFVPLTKEEFLTPIDGNDNAYLLYNKEEIVGLLVLTCNIEDILKEYHLPKGNYMLIDCIMVKEKYRGHGLQREMLKFAYKRATNLHMDGLVATIHPDNKYSLDNFLEEGYKILHVSVVHGGTRNIMIKKTNNNLLLK